MTLCTIGIALGTHSSALPAAGRRTVLADHSFQVDVALAHLLGVNSLAVEHVWRDDTDWAVSAVRPDGRTAILGERADQQLVVVQREAEDLRSVSDASQREGGRR